MKTIVLISCCKRKRNVSDKAVNIYTGNLFRANLNYARSLNPNNIYILSAKYGLLELNEVIDPYEMDLTKQSPIYKRKWAQTVLNQLEKKLVVSQCNFIFLTGKIYSENLVKVLPYYETPFHGMNIFERLVYLKDMGFVVKRTKTP